MSFTVWPSQPIKATSSPATGDRLNATVRYQQGQAGADLSEENSFALLTRRSDELLYLMSGSVEDVEGFAGLLRSYNAETGEVTFYEPFQLIPGVPGAPGPKHGYNGSIVSFDDIPLRSGEEDRIYFLYLGDLSASGLHLKPGPPEGN